MEFESKVYKAGNRFENLVISSLTLKVVYFVLMQIFTVRYISVLFLIPCDLFLNIQMGKSTIEHTVKIIIENQKESFLLLIFTIIILIALLYVAVCHKN